MKRYESNEIEPRLMAFWQEMGTYHFSEAEDVYAVDTPPPTVSGFLHLGHVYSYSHTDFFCRFQRMNGRNVFYPMGFDDNGLPTERLVERQLGIHATDVGRETFIRECLRVSEEAEKDYQALWQRLGLSIDWRHTYRTIDVLARRTSQWAFIDLYHKGLVYRKEAPTIWCPECRTAIAQAELDLVERPSNFYTLTFAIEGGQPLRIATTRPELLPACVAIFVHPSDERFTHLIGQQAIVPLFNQHVPILVDQSADPEKGTGAVMCCTFGDTEDVQWWHTHQLPLIQSIAEDGTLTSVAGNFAGLSTTEARRQIVTALRNLDLVVKERTIIQHVKIHERCDTPIEYISTRQWFVRVLDFKEDFLRAGDQIDWHPPQMKHRYMGWVENLNWDWCISRQRYFGVPFPVWFCMGCGEPILAKDHQLPVDPLFDTPSRLCNHCGSNAFSPETDVMDTWATSSLSPQIAGQLLANDELYQRVFPMSLRPQAHEIIRTWAFYTIVKSHHHFGTIPWKTVAISGWGLAPEGMGKLSKSKGGGPIGPMELIETYSADAVRYWAASTGLGKDAVISVEKVQTGAKLVKKLWNVARFSQRFIDGYVPPEKLPMLSSADRWILARLQKLVQRVTKLFEQYDYAAARSEIETFFWRDLADNYLEMAKQRLYAEKVRTQEGARYALYHTLLSVIKLFAPLLPYVTEEIYQQLFSDNQLSIHQSLWPQVDERLEADTAEAFGDVLIEIATTVRRYKSEHKLSLTTELEQLVVVSPKEEFQMLLLGAIDDLASITRAREVKVSTQLPVAMEKIVDNSLVQLAVVR